MDVVRDSFVTASGPTRLSLVAAGFAEKLRGSYWARSMTWDDLLARYSELPQQLKARPQIRELGELIATAKRLDTRQDKWEREQPIASMDFDRVPVLR
jgi:Ca-activated chloride channel family protein